MLDRFREPRRLIEALRRQKLVNGDEALAKALANADGLAAFGSGATLVTQGGADDHVSFVLAGSVDICVNGRPIAKRHAGEHIGEMALLNPDGRRTATVVASEDTVVLQITEEVFSRLAAEYPVLWRRLAGCLADRLKQRGQYVRQRNETPVMFIGSSREGREIAQAIQAGLSHDDVLVRVWTDQVFGASTYPLEDLAREVSEADFGVLVLSPEDKVTSRGTEQDAPRDNVVLELGLLMGAVGRERTYFVLPRGRDVRIPSDLFGMNPLSYEPASGRDLHARLGPICTALREKVRALGPR